MVASGSSIAAPGRALAFADDPGWSDLLEPLVRDGSGDRAVSDDVLAGVVALLGRWATVWGDRPMAVVPMPSRSRPTLVSDLAARIGAAGRLPLVDVLRAVGPPRRTGSRRRGASRPWRPARSRPAAGLPSGPVLLVDDYAATGWTLTVAAALLREAGAGAVFPLVLHRRAG